MDFVQVILLEIVFSLMSSVPKVYSSIKLYVSWNSSVVKVALYNEFDPLCI